MCRKRERKSKVLKIKIETQDFLRHGERIMKTLCTLPLVFNSGFLAHSFIHLEDCLNWSFSALVEYDNVFRCACIQCTVLVSVD